MRTLTLVALAASAALIPGAALAHPHEGGAPMPMPGAGPAGHAGPMGHAGPVRMEMRHQGQRMNPPGAGHARRFNHIRRIDRGGMLPRPWFGPQFQIRHWGMYGFPQPFAGGRWVRYYDDALLVDRDGRVHDGRYGMDWDRYGDRWGEDERGVPVYVGDGDYEPDEGDYEWAERWEREGRGGRQMSRGHGGGGYGHGQGYGYGGGYGSAYGYGACGCGPMVVTETVTTTAPVVEMRTWYEDVVEYVDVPVRTRAPRAKAKRVYRRAAPPPPRPGERG